MPDTLEKAVSLNWSEADLIFDLLRAARPKHPILGRLRQAMEQLEDQAEQARELVKRAKASGFFEQELSNIKPVIDELRRRRKARLGVDGREVACSSPEHVARHPRIKKLKLRGGTN